MTPFANTLALDREMFSGSVDGGFVLALLFHREDLELDCVEVLTRGAYARDKNTSARLCAKNICARGAYLRDITVIVKVNIQSLIPASFSYQFPTVM